mmetsp:Transcript_24936/g.71969  ORF Transcript_24936/g.71969 Transcript_24936/m.71969 type:complete len:214 (-) Transcript_24936:513-1154(-)
MTAKSLSRRTHSHAATRSARRDTYMPGRQADREADRPFMSQGRQAGPIDRPWLPQTCTQNGLRRENKERLTLCDRTSKGGKMQYNMRQDMAGGGEGQRERIRKNTHMTSSLFHIHPQHFYLVRHKLIRPTQISIALPIPGPRVALRHVVAADVLKAAADVVSRLLTAMATKAQLQLRTDSHIHQFFRLRPCHIHKVPLSVDVNLGRLGEVAGQ